ncbi:zinc finger, CCHC-type containing protein [Tanacetum coccineum]
MFTHGKTKRGGEDETIDTFTAKLTTIVNKAASLGHTMEDETLVRKLLNAVPDRYLQIVASIEQYSDLDEMTLEEAIGRLKTYEERIKYKRGKQVDNQEKLMFTRHENKGKYFRGRGRGKHKFSQGRNHENFKEERKDGENSHKNYKRDNFKKSSYDTSKLQCYKCKKIGHIAPKCPQRTKPNEQSNLVEEDLEPTLLMAILEDEEQKVSLHEKDVGYKETNMDSLWYLDNGASNHMTGVREHFKELDEKVSGKVRFEDGSYIEIKGKEQAIYTKTSKDSTLLIGVYVDDLIITGTPKKEIDKFKAQMEEKFEMSDLGLLVLLLGIEGSARHSTSARIEYQFTNKTMSSLKYHSHSELRLEDIESATNNFASENIIREKTVGLVYQGHMSHSGQSIDIVARGIYLKYQKDENKKFIVEKSMLSSLNHKDQVSGIGFSDTNACLIIYKGGQRNVL